MRRGRLAHLGRCGSAPPPARRRAAPRQPPSAPGRQADVGGAGGGHHRRAVRGVDAGGRAPRGRGRGTWRRCRGRARRGERASRRAAVLLPTPEGPSMATISGGLAAALDHRLRAPAGSLAASGCPARRRREAIRHRARPLPWPAVRPPAGLRRRRACHPRAGRLASAWPSRPGSAVRGAGAVGVGRPAQRLDLALGQLAQRRRAAAGGRRAGRSPPGAASSPGGRCG